MLWLTAVERAVLLASLALALGSVAGRGLGRQYLNRHPDSVPPAPLPDSWALRGSLAGAAACAALALTAAVSPGLAAAAARPPVLGLRGHATEWIALIELACFLLAALAARLRRGGLVVAALLAVIAAEGVRDHPEGMIPIAGAMLTYCHLTPAVLWAGMLAYTLRAAIAWRADPAAVQGLVRLYGAAAAWLLGAVVVTGLLSALVLVPIGSLLTTGYGRILIVKAALVAVAAGMAVAGRMWLRRRIPPGAGPATATRIELALLAAVLAVTGLLTVLTPPGKPIGVIAAGDQAAAGSRASCRDAPRAPSPAGASARRTPRTTGSGQSRTGPCPDPGAPR